MTAKARALAFIREGDWPHYPVLPMKRFGKPGDMADLAIMIDPDQTRLYLGVSPFSANILEQAQRAEQKTFDSLDALLDAGWVVD